MNRVIIGYGILRTILDDVRGKTFCTYPHQLYPSREAAQEGLAAITASAESPPRYSYDVVEVWMGDQP